MNYEQKPGTGTIFKNDRKTESKHPDYQGNYKDETGKEFRVALWVKEGKKGKFFSMAMTEPRPSINQPPSDSNNDDLPF